MSKLHILWTNDNIYTSNMMVLMYSTNSMLHKLWDDVTVIIWGPTARLVSEDELIQEQVRAAMHAGVHFSACANCARQFGVTEKLESLGIEVMPWVEPLTNIIKTNKFLLTV